MVTFKPMGRMGNFLFEAATTIAYAKRHGLEYSIPNRTNNSKHNPLYFQHLVNPNFDSSLPIHVVAETTHAYQEIPFKEEWRHENILLEGYWQTEKYFAHIRDEILRLFGLPWLPCTGVVSIHVRRGDYLRLKHKHPPVGEDWIRAAMKLFPDYEFCFFSDDLPWCRATFGRDPRVRFSKGRNEVEDLAIMSGCEHHICSASTFSWWGAWLNRNPAKRVIMPEHWFAPGHCNLDTSDIVPPNWERLRI